MIWIYAIIIILVLVLCASFFWYFLQNQRLNAKITLTISGIVLVAALIVTHVYISPYYYAYTFESNIRKESPFFNLIALRAPKEFNQYVSQVKEDIINKRDPRNRVYYTAQLINELMYKFASRASKSSLYRFLKEDAAYDKELLKTSPILVLFNENPTKFADQLDFNHFDAAQYEKNLIEMTQNVIQSGIQNTEAPPSPTQTATAKAMFAEIIAEQAKHYGSNLVISALKYPNDPLLDPKKTAAVTISVIDSVIAKGQEKAGLLMQANLNMTR